MRPSTIIVCLLLAALPGTASAQRHANPPYEPATPNPLADAPNLLLRARTSASGQWAQASPHLAVDGKHDANGYWGAENLPQWHMVDLGDATEFNVIQFWPYWADGRHYGYFIEVSEDGQAWTTVVDQRDNTRPGSPAGETFSFEMVKARYLRTTFTSNSRGPVPGGHIVEIQAHRLDPSAIATLRKGGAGWEMVPQGMNVFFGSLHQRYHRETPVKAADDEALTWAPVAWRGERVQAQGLIVTTEAATQVRLQATPFTAEDGSTLPADAMRLRFVRYTLAEGRLTPDILDHARRLDLQARTTRPFWVSVDVPLGAQPGTYTATVTVESASHATTEPLDIRLEVLPLGLQEPSRWAFHLDLWQNPYALARFHGVEPFSEAHFAIMRPHLLMLADAGQKCITTTILHQPWGTQTYDPYDSMVQWTKLEDGSWSFDYRHFDMYVTFADACGIKGPINCYSMIPWTNKVRYRDEATGTDVDVTASLGDPEYKAMWRAFLTDFAAHLSKRGWLDRTAIAMDERPTEVMLPMIELVNEVAPEFDIALAGHNLPELKEHIDDWCVYYDPPLDPKIVKERQRARKPTTFYVCCVPDRPNTFTHSPPAESTLLPLYAAANGYSGFLRWAFDSWTEDPFHETKHVTWAAGDCFLVYPGTRSSIRFELLRDGIEDFEKIRTLRAIELRRSPPGLREAMVGLNEAFAERCTVQAIRRDDASETVRLIQGHILDASRALTMPARPRPPRDPAGQG